ncbi:MAG: LysR family transcriptional regulator substrate-binding protein, partial [Chloroflexi bacterium]|nr:LysR family transcriptional regulator substrate-binding protein [Chloroflexota bacterium]
LDAGEIDLAMVLLPADNPGLVCTTLLAEDLVLVLPRHHPLARRDVLEIQDVRSEPFVLLTAEYGLRQRVVEECERAGFLPEIVFESREVGIIQGLVEAGLGITIIPESAVRHDLATVARPVLSGGRRPQRRIGLAHRADRYLTLAARQLFALARDLFDPEARGLAAARTTANPSSAVPVERARRGATGKRK